MRFLIGAKRSGQCQGLPLPWQRTGFGYRQRMWKILALIVPGPGKYLGCFAETANFLFHGLKLFGLDPI